MSWKNKHIQPFTFYCQKILPLVYDESLSYYETLCKIQKVLNEVIDNQNNLNNAFTELLTYIDKQLETYTKEQLQEWLDDGTLEDLISKLVLTYHVYNNISEVISDNRLKDGDNVQIMNFQNFSDNGGAFYKISTSQGELFSYQLNNGLYANLLPANKMNVHQFGIFGDGKTDITDLFNKAIQFVTTYGDSYLYVPDGTYMVNGIDKSKTPSDTGHLLDAGGIKLLSGITVEHSSNTTMQIIATNYQAYNLYRIYNVHDVTIKGGVLNGDRDTHFGTYGGEWGYIIAISGSKNVHIEDCVLKNAWGDGINLQYLFNQNQLTQEEKTPTNIYLNNVISNMNRRQGASIESGENVVISNCQFINTNGTMPAFGVDIEPGNENSTVNRVYFINCLFDGNENRNLGMYAFTDTSKITNVTIKNCTFGSAHSTDNYNVSVEQNTDNIAFIDNIFNFIEDSQAFIILLNGAGKYSFKSNIFNKAKMALSSNKPSLLCQDNSIIPLQANFFEIFTSKNVTIVNNVCDDFSSGFLLYTSSDNDELIFNNNIMKTSKNQEQILILDNSPNTNVIAVNNIIGGNGTESQITYFSQNGNQKITNGGFSSLILYDKKVNKPREGDIGYYKPAGKLIVYTGKKWVYCDGTDV